MRVADHRSIDFHRTLVELAPRVLVRPREAQFAQRVQDAQPFRGGRDLRQIAADMPLFKGLRGGLGRRARGFAPAPHRAPLVPEALLELGRSSCWARVRTDVLISVVAFYITYNSQ